jgi:CheY-like chemotaxis protein
MATYPQHLATDRFYFPETPFAELMKLRISEVLLVCSNYDRFILEEDGRIDEQVFQEYVSLGLRHPPHISSAPNLERALEVLAEQPFDLVILMLNIDEGQAFAARARIQAAHPRVPVVILTRFSREMSLLLERNPLTS